MSELLDICDADGRCLGVKERDAVHRDGDWHRVFHCWVARRDGPGRDRILLQRRGAGKATFPLHLAVTVGGHYLAGESLYDGRREFREELGHDVSCAALVPCGVQVFQTHWRGLLDNELADTFVYVSERPLADYPVMAPEVADLVAVDVDDGLALFAGERRSVAAQAASGPCRISREDFVPLRDDSFAAAFLLVRRVLNGDHVSEIRQEFHR